jgi:hypothetical protein
MKTNGNDPESAGCELEQNVIDYFGLDPDTVTENTKINTDFGHIVNILAMFRDRIAQIETVITGDIEISPVFPDDEKEECEIKCTHCGVCLDDFSEYYQTEGFCDDCL